MLKIFIGHDERQPVSTNVCQNSIFRRSSKPVQISPLVLSQLPIDRSGLTPFTFSRFLVPWLCDYKGWALFMDCDFIALDDIAKLFDLADDKYSVMVVKSPLRYEWASLILFNCAKCTALTVDHVKTAKNLHEINWVDKSEIGSLPLEWNHLVGYYKPNPEAKLAHFTQGMPSDPILKNCEYGKEWSDELKQMTATQSWSSLMGKSRHALKVKDKVVPRLKVEKPGEHIAQEKFSDQVKAAIIPNLALTSRENPSQRYIELLNFCKQMHEQGDPALGITPDNMFQGISLPRQAAQIKSFIEPLGIVNILDYGCGKGKQYKLSPIKIKGEKFPGILDYWNKPHLTCYDPAYKKFSSVPDGKFDVVISTDVLEHCPEEDLGWIIREMFTYANKGLFANIATYPAKKTLPNGENAHVTIKPAEWWTKLFMTIHRDFSNIRACIMIENGSNQGTVKIDF